MDWLLSITSCVMLWLMGNKSSWGPKLGLLNQVLWYFYIIERKEWGLFLGVTAYTVIHIRNMLLWRKKK